MLNDRRSLRFWILISILLLIGATALAQAKPGVSATRDRPDDPLNRDPARPNAYDMEYSRLGSKTEMESLLKSGNAAREAKPPRYADAEKAYLRAIEINPKESRAYLGLGSTYAGQNRVKETIEAFKKAIELNPKLAEAHYNLGMVYWATNQKEDALKHYEKLQELNKNMAKKFKEHMDKH